MAQAMVKAGHEVSIYTTNIDYDTELDVPLDQPIFKNGVEIRYFPVQKPRFWVTSISLAIALSKVITKYDIVHIHSLYLFHVTVAAYLCRHSDIPYVISPHGTLDPYLYKWHRYRKRIVEFLFDNRNVKNADAIHFITREEQKLAKPYVLGTNSFVVPLGLNIEDYENLPPLGTFRLQYPQLKDQRIILFFGRINFKKGLDILVKSFAKVAKVYNNVHLAIVGPDNEGYGEKVKEWLDQENISDRATFTGILQGVNKLAALRDADLFVLSSYTENFGIAVIEAMACGLPVVISNKVNIWEEICEAQAGRICPCEVDCFAKNMLEVLQNKKLAQEMGDNGKRLVKQSFQWNEIGKLLEREYRLLIQKRSETGKLIKSN
jgi:glycosyltransferase involved in cell wall biosynthesis